MKKFIHKIEKRFNAQLGFTPKVTIETSKCSSNLVQEEKTTKNKSPTTSDKARVEEKLYVCSSYAKHKQSLVPQQQVNDPIPNVRAICIPKEQNLRRILNTFFRGIFGIKHYLHHESFQYGKATIKSNISIITRSQRYGLFASSNIFQNKTEVLKNSGLLPSAHGESSPELTIILLNK